MSEFAARDGGLARKASAPLSLIVVLGALTAFGPVSTDMYLPALPGIAGSLHATDAQAQQTVSAFFIGIAFGQLAYGPLSDRLGRRPPLLVGIALYVAASLGCFFANRIEVLQAFRILQALGACGGMVIARAVVRDRFAPEEVIHVFAKLMLVMGVAPVLAPLLGGFVLLVADWRWIFGLQAAFGAVMGVAVLFGLTESRSEATALQARSEHPFRAYASLLGNRRLLAYLLAGAFSGAALFTYISGSPAVVIGYFHFPPQAFGWVFGANAVGIVAASQINARLARRFASDDILATANIGVFLVSVVLVVCALTGAFGLWGVLTPLFFVIAGLGFNQANASAGALNVDPTRSGATAALLGSSAFAVGAAASGVASVFSDGTPRPMALVIMGSLFLAVAALRTLGHGPPKTASDVAGP